MTTTASPSELSVAWRVGVTSPVRRRPVHRAVAIVVGPRPTRGVLAAHIAGVAGTGFVSVALAGTLFFGVETDASRQRLAAYLIVSLIPVFALVPFIGPAVDRVRGGAARIAQLANLLRALCALGLALSWDTPLFLVWALGLLVGNKMWNAGKYALIPELIERDVELVDTNVRLAKWGGLAGGAATAGALAVLHTSDLRGVLVVASLLFALAAACLLPVGRRPLARRAVPVSGGSRRQRIRTAAVSFVAIRCSVALFTFASAFALRRSGASPAEYALVGGLYAAGIFFGNLSSPVARRWIDEEQMLRLVGVGAGAAALMAAAAPGWVTHLVASAALGLAAAVGRQAVDATVQSSCRTGERGRRYSSLETAVQVGWTVSALAAIWLSPGLDAMWAVIGIACAAAVVNASVTSRTGDPGRSAAFS